MRKNKINLCIPRIHLRLLVRKEVFSEAYNLCFIITLSHFGNKLQAPLHKNRIIVLLNSVRISTQKSIHLIMRKPLSFIPHEKLKPYVSNYAILEIPHGEKHTYFSPPLALAGFIIQSKYSENSFVAKINGKDYFTSNAVATGQVTQPIYGELVGEIKTILVFFHPLGMHYFFGTNMETLTNTSKRLSEFLGQARADQLLTSLTSNDDNLSQIKVLDDFFLSLEPQGKDLERLEEALEVIHESDGDLSVKDLETECHYPRRTLERHFKKIIGLSPKSYIQVYRFKRLINILESNPNITWTDLANNAGYYDQSHMSRYVKEFLKVSPNSIVQLDMEFINYLLNR